MTTPIDRRTALNRIASGLVLASIPSVANAQASSVVRAAGAFPQSVCRWCYKNVALDELAVTAKQLGLHSVELLQPADFAAIKQHGLICAMVSNPTVKVGDVSVGGITKAWNRREYHDALVGAYESHLRAAAEAGFPNLICFSGNRDGQGDEEGLGNCAVGLKRIMPLAEKLGVTVCMELLNSRVNHADYQCDRTEWGVELCRRVGSGRFKLLYDIYHMQIMEGDVIATIRRHHAFIGHYHTAGVPGRHELDENQELNYPAIMRAIAATGFKGFVGQEFIPRSADWKKSLRQAFDLCNVSNPA